MNIHVIFSVLTRLCFKRWAYASAYHNGYMVSHGLLTNGMLIWTSLWLQLNGPRLEHCDLSWALPDDRQGKQPTRMGLQEV